MKKEEIIEELLKLNKEIFELHENLNKVLCEGNGEFPIFYKQCDKIDELIFEIAGIPKDNTLTANIESPDYFCTDGYADLIYEYCLGNEKIEKVIKEIINWKEYKLDI